jgi:hypothetical protein
MLELAAYLLMLSVDFLTIFSFQTNDSIMPFYESQVVMIDVEVFVPNAAKMEWRKLASADEYKAGYEKFLELIHKENTTRWMLNFQQGKKIGVAEQTWTIQEWFPRAMQTNVQKIGIVISTDIFAQIAVRNIVNSITSIGHKVAFFDKEDDAKNWLIQ